MWWIIASPPSSTLRWNTQIVGMQSPSSTAVTTTTQSNDRILQPQSTNTTNSTPLVAKVSSNPPQKPLNPQVTPASTNTKASSDQNSAPVNGHPPTKLPPSNLPRPVSGIPRPLSRHDSSSPPPPPHHHRQLPNSQSLSRFDDSSSASSNSAAIDQSSRSRPVSRLIAPSPHHGHQNGADRSRSEHPNRATDNDSDTSSVFSGSGAPYYIGSKVGSLKNAHHKPGGGNVAIWDEKVHLGPIKSKCGSMANVKHRPGGGDVKIMDAKLNFTKTSHSKVQSLKNTKHMPGGGNVQIHDSKLDYSKASSKVSSMANVKHKPGGGDVNIVDQKLTFTSNASSKVKSLANATHKPGGGDLQIVSEKLTFDTDSQSKVGSLKQAQHRPGGGNVQIFNERLPWLKYNKPNLAPQEKKRINKHTASATKDQTSNGDNLNYVHHMSTSTVSKH